jgi:hypothetical protein
MARGSDSQQRTSEDTSTLEFIKWLTICTSKKSISWQKDSGLVSFTLKGEMKVAFETYETTLGALTWRLFVIRNPEGELLRHTPLSAAIEKPPLVSAIDVLFFAATS